VDDGRSCLVVFRLADPHGLEGTQRRKDRTTDPDRELSFSRGDDLNLHGGRSKGNQFLVQSFRKTLDHGSTTGEADVTVEVSSDIDITLHDGVEGKLVDTGEFLSEEGRLEEGFGGSESLGSNSNGVTIGEFVNGIVAGALFSFLLGTVEVEGDEASLFLHVSDDFSLSGGCETVTGFQKELDEVVSNVSTGKIDSGNGVGKGVTFVNGDSVGNTITGIEDDTGGSSGGVEGKDSLDTDVEVGDVEGSEHSFDHLFSVGLRVKGSFSKHARVLLGGDSELIEVAVMPDLLHIVPVGNQTVLNWVLEEEDTSLGLGFITDEDVLTVNTDHDTLTLGATDDGWEDSLRGFITSDTSLTHTGTVVNNNCGDFVRHFSRLV